MSKIGIIIGRFQPMHNAHLEVIKEASSNVDRLCIILGSSVNARTIKNPWTTKERQQMMSRTLKENGINNVFFQDVRDYLYNDNIWVSSIQQIIDGFLPENEVILFGHKKDSSTAYLDMFPRIKYENVKNKGALNATRVREAYFCSDIGFLRDNVPAHVFDTLVKSYDTDEFEYLKKEYNNTVQYKQMWVGAPYPVTFVTTDAVVVRSGHVLVVKRKFSPGMGLYALPGGFLNQGETLLNGCIRELKEETQIAVSRDNIISSLVESRVFDHPDRSLRGRTITHAYRFDMGGGDLPRVKGGDDAEHSFWMPINDVFRNEELFFEDHFHILYYFLTR